MVFRSSVFKGNVGVQTSQSKNSGVREFGPYKDNFEFRRSPDKLKYEAPVAIFMRNIMVMTQIYMEQTNEECPTLNYRFLI